MKPSPNNPNAVQPGCECPQCQEWSMDLLVWIDDDTVECATCGTRYQPATGNPPASREAAHDGP